MSSISVIAVKMLLLPNTMIYLHHFRERERERERQRERERERERERDRELVTRRCTGKFWHSHAILLNGFQKDARSL